MRARGRAGAQALAAAALTLAALALATTASAHHGEPATGETEPGTIGSDNTGDAVSTDTELTPVAKDGEAVGWERIAGAKFGSDRVPDDSITPFDADLFSVDFLDQTNGFAAGAQCRRDPAHPAAPLPAEETGDCERVPVIYRFRDDFERGLIWEESYRGSDASDPGGFVGALTWLGPDRALAVGGTGTYPRREPGCVTGSSECRDPAGMARAWLYESGAWRELRNLPDGTEGDEVPDQMRALSALDASPRPSDCGPEVTTECAIAGGLAQLWHFKDGGFEQQPYSAQSPPERMANASAFRFRVRDIRFFPGESLFFPDGSAPESAHPLARAIAVTSGCCAQLPADDRPAWLRFDGSKWHAALGGSSGRFNPDSYYAAYAFRPYPGYPQADRVHFSVIRTPGGPSERYAAGEPASRFAALGGQPLHGSSAFGPPRCDSEDCAARKTAATLGHEIDPSQVQNPHCAVLGCQGGIGVVGAPHPVPVQGAMQSTLRLVSADGDAGRFCSGCAETEKKQPDGFADWAVGSLRSSGRGVAYTTVVTKSRVDPTYAPDPRNCVGEDTLADIQGLCSPEGYEKQLPSEALFALDSYALNAFRVTGVDLAQGDQGTGWAVGDHGAILRFGGEGKVGASEDPPSRSGLEGKSAPLAGAEIYGPSRPPATTEPGTVPALAGHSVTPLGEPGFVSAQTPLTQHHAVIRAMVMSRDGSEGWATVVGQRFFHYDGLRWRPCTRPGAAGFLDPACAGLDSLRGSVAKLARVPLERDSDPTNDDQFEAVALTEQGLWRYDGNRWSEDKHSIGGSDIVFVAPDDAWLVSAGTEIRHFTGEEWVRCAVGSFDSPPECADPGKRLNIRFPHIGQGGGGIQLALAGERVYLYSIREERVSPQPGSSDSDQNATEPYPVLIYRDPGGVWGGGTDTTDDGVYNPTDGGWDPGCDHKKKGRFGRDICAATGSEEDQGRVYQLSVADNGGGDYEGWAVGEFGGTDRERADAVLMHLDGGRWEKWIRADAADDYLRPSMSLKALRSNQLLILPRAAGERNAFLLGSVRRLSPSVEKSPGLVFDQDKQRWQALPTPWWAGGLVGLEPTHGDVSAAASDGRGGFWAAVTQGGVDAASGGQLSFHHYTDRAPTPVFEDVAQPARDALITAMGGGADGSLWLGDESGSLYHYDRLTGWDRPVRVPEWEARIATNPAEVSAIAVGPDGSGVAVGPGGRIADISRAQVRLDPAATAELCDPNAPSAPCGTGYDLLAAAVAPDGSAIVAGESRSILWRSAGGDFRRIAQPPVPKATAITDISMPRADRAYLLTRNGALVAGEMSGAGAWSWRIELENVGAESIAVDSSGHGYAVGAGSGVLERTGPEGPWEALESGHDWNFESVAIPTGGGEGAIIGGFNGLILTLDERGFEVARHADPYDPTTSARHGTGQVIDSVLIPGPSAGSIEAWAVLRGPASWPRRHPPQALLHYGSDAIVAPHVAPGGLAPLPDTVAPRVGELSFAAFGKQDCASQRYDQLGPGDGFSGDEFIGAGKALAGSAPPQCSAANGSNLTTELIARRVSDELQARAGEIGAPAFAVFTGDAADSAGGGAGTLHATAVADNELRLPPLDRDLKHRRWVELVADPLAEGGLPLFGAIGGQDLANNPESCHPSTISCTGYGGLLGLEQLGVKGGPNLPWRKTMATMPAPWVRDQGRGSLRFVRLEGGALSADAPDAETPTFASPGGDPATSSRRARLESQTLRGADTHYATDVIRDGVKVARIVVVDTSLRSLSASDPFQQPFEAGGQLRWLEEVLCFEGSPEDTNDDARDCTREPGQQAIVVSNTPTYSYGPISPEELQTDAAVFESVLLKNQVNVVVSGRLGWNGRYWALAPGVHAPCPGEPYRPDSNPPSLTDAEVCGAGAGEQAPDPTDQLPPATEEAAGLASRGALPFVVSSTAGGRFNFRAERSGFASAESGFWRGYSIVHLDPSGDPRKTVVEQRPILNWVGLAAPERVLAPRSTLKLESFAEEAYGVDSAPRYYPIDFEGITHRYDLLLADPEEPWVPCEAEDVACQALYSRLAAGSRSLDSAIGSADRSARDDIGECEPYLCLPERVGTVDATTGEVMAGDGRYPRTFAVAMLSVGEHVASSPLVFERSPSFVLSAFGQPPEVPAPGANVANAPTAPAPPPAPKPPIPQVNTPEPPLPPAVPPIAATLPPEPQPPAPPAPPPPTEQPSPLNLTLAPPSIAIATPTAVIQPPTPPVNPAPPGGARREARQRQAATQKSGMDSDQESQARDAVGDLAGSTPSAHGAEMTRYDGARQEHSFSRYEPLARASDPSPLGQGLLYAGGLTMLAAALALGRQGVRPTPRRTPPEVPAAAAALARARRPH